MPSPDTFFLSSVAQLALGLALGGVCRKLPRRLPWSVAQKLEMLPTLLHGAVLTHWSRKIDRYLATPVFALLYEVRSHALAALIPFPPAEYRPRRWKRY